MSKLYPRPKPDPCRIDLDIKMLHDLARGLSYRQLAQKYKINHTTIWCRLNKTKEVKHVPRHSGHPSRLTHSWLEAVLYGIAGSVVAMTILGIVFIFLLATA